ncbi:hypothetical protein GCM10028824_22500 [Hymenobacter segetis]|uniref:T9SS type A sorting domain-containing protein n=1 Tax=Hymenobacter segetis TaxID=2025509 RepID=A0ABU9LUR1_9BACT
MNFFSSFFFVGLLVLLLLALHMPAAAQVPAWQSARAVAAATAAAANNYSEVRATAVDAAGNVYLTGIFSNTVVLGGTTLTSLGSYDVFVAKFNPVSNQFVWAQRAGGTSYEYATALAVDGSSVYVAGYFGSSTAGFGLTTLTNAGFDDVFVAKLTDGGSTGSFVWAQRAGGPSNDDANALAVSGTSVYVAGAFGSSTLGFGPTTLTNIGGTSGAYDVFVAKLTDAGSTGSFVWAQRAGGTDYDGASALAVSGTSVYVAGEFGSATAGFGATTLANVGTTVGNSDIFVAKLTDAGSTGSFAWAQRAGGTDYDGVGALAVSGTSVYVAGGFRSPIASFGTTALTNTGAYDAYVARLTDTGSMGSFNWAQRAGGTGYEFAKALAVNGSSVYMVGYFRSPTADFGPTMLTNTNTVSSDVFVSKLTDVGNAGNFVWAQRAGGADYDEANALAVSGTSVYVAGFVQSLTASFGSITLPKPSSNNALGFLATLTDPTLTATAAARTLTPEQLFPNPAHGTATLRLPAGTAPAPLTLTDALGRAVRRYPAPDGPEAALDLQGLPAGLYLLRGAGPVQRLAVE